MSKRYEQMAATRKANQKRRGLKLHAEQVKRRDAERVQRAALWAKTHAKQPA